MGYSPAGERSGLSLIGLLVGILVRPRSTNCSSMHLASAPEHGFLARTMFFPQLVVNNIIKNNLTQRVVCWTIRYVLGGQRPWSRCKKQEDQGWCNAIVAHHNEALTSNKTCASFNISKSVDFWTLLTNDYYSSSRAEMVFGNNLTSTTWKQSTVNTPSQFGEAFVMPAPANGHLCDNMLAQEKFMYVTLF